MGKTPHRVIRVEDELWRAAQECAAAEDTTVSEVVRAGLRRYVRSRRKNSGATPLT